MRAFNGMKPHQIDRFMRSFLRFQRDDAMRAARGVKASIPKKGKVVFVKDWLAGGKNYEIRRVDRPQIVRDYVRAARNMNRRLIKELTK